MMGITEGTDSKSLEVLLQRNDSIIWMLDAELKLLDYNLAFEYWFKAIYQAEPVKLMPVSRISRNANQERAEQWMARYLLVFKTKQPQHFKDQIEFEGRLYNLSISIFPEVEDGSVTRITIFSRNINTQLQEEQNIQTARNEFKQMVDMSDAVFWIWGNDKVLYINNAYERLFGREKSEVYLQSSNFFNWIHPSDKQKVKTLLCSETYQKRGLFREEFRIVKPDGHITWLLVRTFPIGHAQGTKKLLGIAEEITDRKKIELAGKSLSVQFQSILESTEDMIFSVDKHYRYTVFNQRHKHYMLQTYGCNIEVGVNLLECLSERKNIKKIKADIDRALAGEQYIMERAYGKGNVHKSYAEVSLNPIKGEHNHITGVSVFVRDITKRRHVEVKMNRNQQLLTSINRNINEAIFRSTAQEGLVYVNQAFVDMFGFKNKQDALSTPSDQLYHDIERRNELVAKILKDSLLENEQVTFKKKDGSLFTGLINSSITIDEEGKSFFDGALRDVTTFQQTQQELAESNAKLQKINKQLDRFVYTASHDLKAPLSSISGLISIYRQEPDAKMKETYIDLMEKSVHKLEGFIRDIVSYSRNTRVVLNPEAINLQEFTKDIFDTLSFSDNADSLEYQIQVSGLSSIHTDRMRLENILRNLISNAINYSDKKKPKTKISITAEITEAYASITITDNGIGISEEDLPKIFEMFYRASGGGDGSGLGLFIVAEAVEILEGKIDVQSKPKEGTSFTIQIPQMA